MLVTELAPDEQGHGWDEYVESHPGGTLFHTSAWRDLVTRHFSHRPRYLEARSEGRRVGVLPLFETRSLLSGKGLVSVPYAVYGGPLATAPGAEQALVERVRALVDDDGHRFCELRCRVPPVAELPASDLYATFVRALPSDPDECLGMIPRKSRATTRQARDRHGLTFREAPELLAEFHRLFVNNKRSLGSPAFAQGFFRDVMRLATGGTRLHVVCQGNQVVVAVISFTWGNVFNPYYSGALPGAEGLGASNFMYWKLMCTATEEGFARFDFGRSRVETGPYRFKKNMGFDPTPLPYRYVLAAGREIPSVNPSNPAYSLPRKVIQHLPTALVRAVGPLLMRLVP